MPWDDNSGDWQGLGSSDQISRYRSLAKLIGVCSVLDVGCGEGILRHFLDGEYLGIEPSAKAANGKSYIVHSTAEAFQTASHWNCVVFNEVLYYSRDPLALLRKYGALADRIVISIYQNPRKPSLRKRLEGLLNPRLPVSNLHCSEMVSNFISTSGWQLGSDDVIAGRWRMWAITTA